MAFQTKTTPFERDFKDVKDYFPRLSYTWNQEGKTWVVRGELDICDVEGVYWNTFDIAILVPEAYPYCVPIIIERSEIIPRDIDWHISKEGICCVDSDNSLLAMSKRGINLKDFLSDKIYNYFANQLYKLQEREYAGEEYKHFTEGTIQYYIEELRIPSIEHILVFLNKILSKGDLTRNKLCPCGSGRKIKKCHEKEIDTIKSFGRSKIEKDFIKIKKHKATSQICGTFNEPVIFIPQDN